MPFTTDLNGVDLALFVVQVPSDFPDMPYLARLLDGIPRERRVVVDLWGRFNDTIRLEHDFNHLEKLDGHLGLGMGGGHSGGLRHDPAADAGAAAAERALVPVPRLRSGLGGEAIRIGRGGRGGVARRPRSPTA